MKTHSFLVGIFLVLLSTLLITHVQTNVIQGRIISGIPAAVGQFPWQVILKKDEYDTLLCGGSIISNSWVLTAAHCTYGLTNILLVFGTIDLYNNANNMTSDQIFVHPRYDPLNLNNDISLIKLPTLLVLSRTIQPIVLVSTALTSQNLVGATAIIAGFGYTDDEYLDYSRILLWAQVQIINNDYCAKIYGNDTINETNICSTGEGNTNMSICSGDSGGPLIMFINGSPVQIGINSFVAEDQCTKRFPSGYVNLSLYLNYISNVTGLKFT